MVYPLHNLISEHKKWLLAELTSKCNYACGYLVPPPSHTYIHTPTDITPHQTCPRISTQNRTEWSSSSLLHSVWSVHHPTT